IRWLRSDGKAHCSGRSAVRLDQLCFSIACVTKFHARRSDERSRSNAALFHLWYHLPSQTGGAYSSELSGRASDHNVLAWSAAWRHASRQLVAGLGEACV